MPRTSLKTNSLQPQHIRFPLHAAFKSKTTTHRTNAMPLSESERTAAREELERQEMFLQKLSTIHTQIHQVEIKLVDEFINIRRQLQELDSAFCEAKRFFDEITKRPAGSIDPQQGPSRSGESGESSELSTSQGRPESEASPESDSESGDVYFIIDDVEEYNKIVAYFIRQDLEELLAARAETAPEAGGNGEGSSGGPQ